MQALIGAAAVIAVGGWASAVAVIWSRAGRNDTSRQETGS